MRYRVSRHPQKGWSDWPVSFDPNAPIEGDFSEQKFYSAVAGAMSENGVNWCDACRVLALHTPGINNPMDMAIHDVFEACAHTPLTATALGVSPVSLAKLTADCGSCSAGQIANADGSCVPACPVDVVIDAGTLTNGSVTFVNTGASVAGDTCPETFVLRMESHHALFGGTDSTRVSLGPASEGNCPGDYTFERVLMAGDGEVYASAVGTGVWSSCLNGPVCNSAGGECTGIPFALVKPADAETVEYRTPVQGSHRFVIAVPTALE